VVNLYSVSTYVKDYVYQHVHLVHFFVNAFFRNHLRRMRNNYCFLYLQFDPITCWYKLVQNHSGEGVFSSLLISKKKILVINKMLRDLANAKKMNEALTEILVFVLAILISTFVLRFAWNKSLVKHITVLKPINTFLDAFILSLAIAVVRGV